jgi:hypothetical protein
MAIGIDDELDVAAPSPQAPIPAAKVQRAMEHVLASRPFRTSKQCQKLLEYVVLHTLNGKEEELKERVIGSEVFDRPLDYNTADDPVVRIRAADVRKRLAMYYQDEGLKATVRITMPSGSYRTFFELFDHSHDRASSTTTLPSIQGETGNYDRADTIVVVHNELDEPPSRQRTTSTRRMIVAACALLIVIVSAGIFALRTTQVKIEQFATFWDPINTGPRPPIVYVGSSAVYRLTTNYLDRYQAAHPGFKADRTGREFTVPLSSHEQISSGDLVPDERTFVTVGDVAAAVSITSMFAERKQPYDLRFSKDVVFGDFRSTSVVLIGAFNNSWTIELNDKLPFAFDANNSIRETQGLKRVWRTVRDDQGIPHEDFALISRQVSAKSGKSVITVAGLDQTGTRAAAEFVRDPARLDSALRKLPAGWQNKNLQLVLHTNVLDYLPSGTEVIASAVQ